MCVSSLLTWRAISICTLVSCRVIAQTSDNFLYLSFKLNKAFVLKDTELTGGVSNTAKLISFIVSDANGICVDVEVTVVMYALDLITDICSWIIRTTVCDKHNINAICILVQSTFLCEQLATGTLSCTCSVGTAPPVVLYATDGLTHGSLSLEIVKTVEAELEVITVIKQHYCHSYMPTEESRQCANGGSHSFEVASPNTPRRVEEKQDIVGITGACVTTEPITVLTPHEREWDICLQ